MKKIKSRKIITLALILIVLFLLLLGCTGSNATAPETADFVNIRLPMGYIPDPQYAPFYVAVEKGYFAAEGLEIEFDYSFETDGMALVGSNELPFALVGGDQVILARAQGIPVVYIFEWFQRYPIAVVSKEAANNLPSSSATASRACRPLTGRQTDFATHDWMSFGLTLRCAVPTWSSLVNTQKNPSLSCTRLQ